MPPEEASAMDASPSSLPKQGEIEQYTPANVDPAESSVSPPDKVAPESSLNGADDDLELGLRSCSGQAATVTVAEGQSSEIKEPVTKPAPEELHLKELDDDDEEGQCRVCHLVCDVELGTTETMQLGCHCKDELGIAHRNCAEAWFKIKGNRICEICGATAENIVGNEDPNFMEQWNNIEVEDTSEPQARCWQSLSLCNFFLACMVVTFILLWLFRVTIS